MESKPFNGGQDASVYQDEARKRLELLRQSDLDIIRVLEDVVHILVERGIISFTDLPEAARIKLDQRAVARAELEGLADCLPAPLFEPKLPME